MSASSVDFVDFKGVVNAMCVPGEILRQISYIHVGGGWSNLINHMINSPAVRGFDHPVGTPASGPAAVLIARRDAARPGQNTQRLRRL
jgi:hypothetical protein